MLAHSAALDRLLRGLQQRIADGPELVLEPHGFGHRAFIHHRPTPLIGQISHGPSEIPGPVVQTMLGIEETTGTARLEILASELTAEPKQSFDEVPHRGVIPDEIEETIA